MLFQAHPARRRYWTNVKPAYGRTRPIAGLALRGYRQPRAWSVPRRLEDGEDLLLVLRGGPRAQLLVPDQPVAIDDEGGRVALDGRVGVDDLVVGHDDRVVDAVLLDEPPDDLGAVGVD